MDGFDFADGPYRIYLELFVRYKRGKGEQGGRNLLSACKKIGVGLEGESDASGLDERADLPYVAWMDHDGDFSWNSNNYVHGPMARIRPRK